MAHWRVTNGDPIQVECLFDPRCVFHDDTRLVPKNLSPIFFPVYVDGKPTLGHAFDLKLNCPKCGASELFGVAVSEAEWEQLTRKEKT